MHSLLFDDTNMMILLFLNGTFLPCALLKGGTTIGVMYVCMYIQYNVLTHCIYSMCTCILCIMCSPLINQLNPYRAVHTYTSLPILLK